MESSIDTIEAKAIGVLKRRLDNARTSMAKAQYDTLQIVDEMQKIAGKEKTRALLETDCGFPRSDVATMLSFKEKLGDTVELLRTREVPFTVVKELIASDAETRAIALIGLKAGGNIDRNSISKLRAIRRRDALGPAACQALARRKSLHSAAASHAPANVAGLSAQVTALLDEIYDFTYWHIPEPGDDQCDEPASSEEFMEAKSAICASAAKVLDEFRRIYGSPECKATQLPPAGDASARLRLAAAHVALERLSDGKFAWDGGFAFKPYRLHATELQDALEFLLLIDMSSLDPAPSQTADTKQLTFLELCAGAGGQAIGLMQAGLRPLALYEMNGDAVKTLKRNWPWNVRKADLQHVSDEEFLRYRGVDVLSGGLDCRPYSTNGTGEGPDHDLNLFDEAVRIVGLTEPKAFFFENVMGFNSAKFTSYRAEVYRQLGSLGYEVSQHELDASHFGLAQDRKRIAIVGIRRELGSHFEPPGPQAARVTMWEQLADLIFPNRNTGDADYDSRAERWFAEFGSERSYTVVANLFDPQEKTKKNWLKSGFITDPKAYGGGKTDGEGVANDALLPHMTVEIAARLQGFPPRWRFAGAPRTQMRQIGNAFPPAIAKAVGLRLREALLTALPGTESPVSLFDEEAIGLPAKPKINLNGFGPDSDDLELAAACYGDDSDFYKFLVEESLTGQATLKNFLDDNEAYEEALKLRQA